MTAPHKTPYLAIRHMADGRAIRGSFHLGTQLDLARDIVAEYATYNVGVVKVDLCDNDWNVIETVAKSVSATK